MHQEILRVYPEQQRRGLQGEVAARVGITRGEVASVADGPRDDDHCDVDEERYHEREAALDEEVPARSLSIPVPERSQDISHYSSGRKDIHCILIYSDTNLGFSATTYPDAFH
jgi:hypothetical protein